MVIVKKYGNRRLYDTGDSTYVTLAEVAAKIRAGADVRIVDATTDEDITPQMLTQIIFEDRDTARLLPVSLLVQLIRMGDDALAEFFSRYVTWALEVYQQARQGLGALPSPFGLNPFARAAFGAMNPFAEDELAALRREIEELKKAQRKNRR